MNQDIQREIEKRVRGVMYHLACALVAHFERDFLRSRKDIDDALEVAIFGETKFMRRYRIHVAKQQIKVTSDVQDANS